MLEAAIALLIASLSIVLAVSDAFEPWAGQGDLGWGVEPGGRIARIKPDSAAARAGLVPGDVIDAGGTPRELRRYFVSLPPAGTRVPVTVDGPSGRRTVELTAAPFPRTALGRLNIIIADFVAVILPVFALTLVFLRPSGLTWALLLYAAIGSDESGVFNTYAPLTLFVPLKAYADLLWYSLWFVVVAFVLRFPNDRLDVPRRRAERWLRAVLCVVLALAGYVTLWPVFDPPGVAPIAFLLEKLNEVGAAAALLMLFVFFVRADARDRPRIGWILGGFAVGLGGQLLAALPTLGDFPLILNLAVPLSIAYAIQHRVIDIRFALSRALVYGVLTTLAVVSLAVVHFFASRQFEEFRLGFLFDLAGAVAIGWGIQFVHGWVESLVDRYVFRDVHDAEQRLERAGAAMLHAHSSATVEALLCAESTNALRLASVAVFVTGDVSDDAAPFRRATALGWENATLETFSAEDPLVLYLKAQEEPVDASEVLDGRAGLPQEAGAPLLGVPMIVRHRMSGFVLFGGHANGVDLDPDERRLLHKLTRSAATAVEHALVEEKISENVALRAENGALKAAVARVPGAIST